MSYCRFSSDNFRCDVYVYEDAMSDHQGCFTTHVAVRRYLIPLPPQLWWRYSLMSPSTFRSRLVWWWDRNVVRLAHKVIPLVKIGLPHDGATFFDVSAADCAQRLKGLREEGYRAPQWAIDELEREAKDVGDREQEDE